MSLVDDEDNCGRDSSNKLGRWTQGLFDLGLVGKTTCSKTVSSALQYITRAKVHLLPEILFKYF